MDEPSIGQLVRSRRVRLGLTQRELAVRSGLSVRAVGNIERGQVARVQPASISRLSDVLGLSPAEITHSARRPSVSVGVLGPLLVRPAGLAATKQRSLLALLALQEGTRVGRDEIADVLWDGQPPASGPSLVHTYVARLRKVLPDGAITNVHNGYVFRAQDIALDLAEFDSRVTQAERLARDGDLDAAEEEFAAALALWRGPLLADLPGRIRTGPVSTAITARRLAAVLAHADVAAALGRHSRSVVLLRALADTEPLHEGLHARLVLALGATGNQSAALQLYSEIRDRLGEELGVSPGAELQQAHRHVLREDTHPGPPVPRQLPQPPRWFTGRTTELATIDAEASGSITVLAGAGGMGKTWLGLRWAYRNLDRFPDGQLFVDLRGFSPDTAPMDPAMALRGFLLALGVRSDRLPVAPHAQAALFRSLVAGKRMLIMLDNAADTAQVLPLLPGGQTCVVLVTSRTRLAGLIIGHGAHQLTLDTLSDAEAEALLTTRLGHARIAAAPGAVRDLIRSCGGFPLALSIVAGHAHTRPRLALAALATELDDLGLSALHDDDPIASLPAVLSWSYRALTPEQRKVFTLLGTAPGPDIGTHAAASLTGLGLSGTTTVLRELEHASLITTDALGRHRMHDLIRHYATTHGDLTDHEREAALRRVLDFYLHTAHAADHLLYPQRPPIKLGPASNRPQPLLDEPAALTWFDTEHVNLLAAQHTATTLAWHDTVWQLAWTLISYHYRRGHREADLTAWQSAVAAVAHLSDPTTHILVHRLLGVAYADLGRHEEAIEHLHHALTAAGNHNDTTHQAHIHRLIAWAWEQRGDGRQALSHSIEALHLFQAHDDQVGEADALNAVGWLEARLGDYDTARAYCRSALELHRSHHNIFGEASTLDSLGYIDHHTGHHHEAISHYRRAATLRRTAGDTYQSADTLDQLGHPHAALGQVEEARAVWQEALNLYRGQERHEDALRVQQQLDALKP